MGHSVQMYVILPLVKYTFLSISFFPHPFPPPQKKKFYEIEDSSYKLVLSYYTPPQNNSK